MLAADPDVAYISLDNAVRSSGHVTNTTGTQQVRAQKSLLGLNNTLDGSGVTIAVLDSGIDSKHKSFATTGKIKFSKDFTGENRTDDPWGHGTHVAAIAAGDGAPTGGAYEGIAPAASLVNLRVLNSQGVGRVSGVLAALDWLHRQQGHLQRPRREHESGYSRNQLLRRRSDLQRCSQAGRCGRGGSRRRRKQRQRRKRTKDLRRDSLPRQRAFRHHSRRQQQLRHRSAKRRFSHELQLTWSNPQLLGRLLRPETLRQLIKPDLVAPGNKIIAAEAVGNGLLKKYPELETYKYSTTNMKLMYLSGTSMSTPMVAGAAALLLEANSSLTPNMVKVLLMYTAQPLAGFNTLEQGAGQLNVAGAVTAGQDRSH